MRIARSIVVSRRIERHATSGHGGFFCVTITVKNSEPIHVT